MSEYLADYDYHLPAERIAHEPLPLRDAARLMVVDRRTGQIAHRLISDLPELLSSSDRLILNDTRVIPARLVGHRTATGGQWEGLFLRVNDHGEWLLMGQTRGKLGPGETVTLRPNQTAVGQEPLMLTLRERDAEGIWRAIPNRNEPELRLLQQFGRVPLPPYIDRDEPTLVDNERYQTIFAATPGSVAAPTAGLHFTPELLARCDERGISRDFVTLHVGIGTFRPITAERLDEHQMHAEFCEVSEDVAARCRTTRVTGGRIVSVGTTSARTLETAASYGTISAYEGETRLFIRPGFRFNAMDVLVTNFHLPKSTLLVLVSAFAGRKLIRDAYAAAIAEHYRFFSYGDAMLIL